MRILYLVHQFFPRYYMGTERFTLDLAEQMQKMGHSPLIVTYERDIGQEGFTPLNDDVLVKTYTYRTIPVISLRETTASGTYGILNDRIAHAFDKLEVNCDIVHICHPMWLSSIAKTYKSRNIPVVLTLTDSWLLCPSFLIDRGYRLCNGPDSGRWCITNCGFDAKITARYGDSLSLLGMADSVITSSNFTASLFRENGWNGEIQVVRHSINYRYVMPTENFDPANMTFGFIGSLSWHKGAHVLVKAFRKTSSQNIRLKVYGSRTEEWDYYKELLALAQRDDRIQFLDPFGMEALPDIMSRISTIVVPSVYYDNYPLVTLIGLAYRVPVIASKIGGVPEIVEHGVSGFLFDAGRSDELAEIIENVAREPRIIENMRDNIVTPRRTEEEALDYERIYMKLASG